MGKLIEMYMLFRKLEVHLATKYDRRIWYKLLSSPSNIQNTITVDLIDILKKEQFIAKTLAALYIALRSTKHYTKL